MDGMIDSDTRAAIQEFQDDHQLAATGVIDPKTGELPGIVVFESSKPLQCNSKQDRPMQTWGGSFFTSVCRAES